MAQAAQKSTQDTKDKNDGKNTPDATNAPQNAPQGPQGPKAEGLVEDLFRKAQEFKQEREEVLKDIDHNRKALRTLADAGVLTDEQVKRIDEFYPPRTNRKSSENGTAETADTADTASVKS